MAKATVATIKLTDNYVGLPSGVGSVQELTDTALAAIAAVYAKNIADGTAFQDNVATVFKEATEQQVVE